MSGALDDEGTSDGPTERQRGIRTAVRALTRQAMGLREAASLTEYGKDWVSERVREWRGGDYREIVGFGPPNVESDGDDAE